MLEHELVKPPQRKRGKGLSTVYRTSGVPWGLTEQNVYVKTQQDYNCRPAWRFWRLTPTFLCEIRALKACQTLAINIPAITFYRTEEGIAELVLEEIPDALPLDIFSAQASDDRVDAVLLELGRMVGLIHRAGWKHGALAPDHVLIQPKAQDKVWLIDFEKARRTLTKRAIEADLARLWRRSPFLKDQHIDRFFSGYRSVRPDGCEDARKTANQIRRSRLRHSASTSYT